MRVENQIRQRDFEDYLPWILGGGFVLSGIVWLWASRRAQARETATRGAGVLYPPQDGVDWADPSWPRRLSEMIAKTAPVLGDDPDLMMPFFLATSYHESRGNASACGSSCGPDSERGVFQLRPSSVKTPLGPVDVAAKLLDPRYNFLQALLYRNRLRAYTSDPQNVRQGDIRAGWRYPALVDAPWNDATKAEVIDRFRKSLEKVGYDPLWAESRAFGPGYVWSPSDEEPLAQQLASVLGI